MHHGDEILRSGNDPRAVICELCRRFYAAGWASGTGGGISVRMNGQIYVAPSGVHKELIAPEDVFTVDIDGKVLESPANPRLKPSECTPLFLHAYRERDAGAVIHMHSMHAMTASLLVEDEFRITHIEMIKGISGHGYQDQLVVPVLENTPREAELADAIGEAIRAYPKTFAVLVRRHGVYVWGRDWAQAKGHAECYDYLFEAYVRMHGLGLDPAQAPARK